MKEFAVRFEVENLRDTLALAKVHCILSQLGIRDGVVVCYQTRERLTPKGAEKLPSVVEVVLSTLADAQTAQAKMEALSSRIGKEFGLAEMPSVGFQTR